MRWRDGRQSDNVEDERDQSGSDGGSNGGGGLRLGLLGSIAVVIIGTLLGGNPITLLSMVGGNLLSSSSAPTSQHQPAAANDEGKQFISTVLAETEDVWGPMFQQMGGSYVRPKLVLFTNSINSACGNADAATGPFYCPADQKVYIDLGFFRELKSLGAKGEFAQAYVLGHEVGHHVQKLLGISDKVSQMQARMNERDGNALSVKLELQADCYAGVWANHAKNQLNVLDSGDAEDAINAAGSIGDDRLQQMAGRHITPDSFTHGSSKQRMHWFEAGFQTGDLASCDTFKNP